MIKIMLLSGFSGVCLSNILLLPKSIVKVRERLSEKFIFLKHFLDCNICFTFWINLFWNIFILYGFVPFTYIINLSSIFTVISISVYLFVKAKGLHYE